MIPLASLKEKLSDLLYLEDVGLEDEGVVDGDLLDLGHLFKHNASAAQG